MCPASTSPRAAPGHARKPTVLSGRGDTSLAAPVLAKGHERSVSLPATPPRQSRQMGSKAGACVRWVKFHRSIGRVPQAKLMCVGLAVARRPIWPIFGTRFYHRCGRICFVVALKYKLHSEKHCLRSEISCSHVSSEHNRRWQPLGPGSPNSIGGMRDVATQVIDFRRLGSSGDVGEHR